MDKFRNKYRIPSNRLQGFDYGSHGYYFVTICTKDRIHYFGEAETGNCPSLQITQIGEIANKYWLDISNHYPFVEVDEFIIMPNHIHGILFFNKPNKIDWIPNSYGIQSQNLGAVIRGYKSSVKRYANVNNIDFHWQDRYHDRIIRDDKELNNIRGYIMNNVQNWEADKLNIKL